MAANLRNFTDPSRRLSRQGAAKKQPSIVDPPTVPWQDRPLITVKLAAEVSGISPSSIYRLAHEGKLVLRRLAGRVLVETAGLIKTIEGAEPWTPSDHGRAGRERNAELARAAWRD